MNGARRNRLGFSDESPTARRAGPRDRSVRQASRAANGARLRRGCLPGTADTYVLWNNVTVWLERKAGAGGLGTGQDAFRDAVLANGGHWALVRSTEDVEAALRAAGIPLRATLGEIRDRIADQRERLPAKPKRAARTKATPRHVASAGLLAPCRRQGFLVMSAQRRAALAAFQAGARTYRDIQRVLGIRPVHARVVVYNLAVAGLIQRRGYLPQDGRPGRRASVYEITGDAR